MRSLPDTVVETLEAIKLFLSVKKMAFVIAADEENVASAIGRRLATTGQPITSRLYLEKIVQVPVRIPALGRDQTEEYLALLMLADLERIDEAVARIKGSRPAKPGQLVHRLGETLPADRHGEVELAEALTPLLHRHTLGNPRRLKRFLNAYWLRMSFASARGVDLQPDAMAKLMLAELHMPDLFGQLLGWLAAGVVADKVAEIEAGAGDHSAGVRDWGELPPRLPAGDLAKTFSWRLRCGARPSRKRRSRRISATSPPGSPASPRARATRPAGRPSSWRRPSRSPSSGTWRPRCGSREPPMRRRRSPSPSRPSPGRQAPR